ncbi:DUF805 domain-containing protein [Thiohalocapsa marina]|uniref:DUF805 domain-containing protein n=1 Tax=Thiohalocapsa marina TaxID=424902 RepID=A0A5M8FK64_9GAMM|nr:DUF805 domain-containing protein [Thiohalocapsa marina]KAA6185288.1 DUF805 domain-containing protein [Thiohalocapsa marina]
MNLLKPTGTAGRLEFVITWVICVIVAAIAFGVFEDGARHVQGELGGLWLVWWLGMLAAWIGIAAVFRRVRDIGWAWGHGFWQFVPLLGFVFVVVCMFIPSRHKVG